MIPQRLKTAVLCLFCAVMLAVQWVQAHAHLDTAHHHDGSSHEHVATVHAHQPGSDHRDAIDVGDVAHHLDSTVDLEHSSCPGKHRLDHGYPNAFFALAAAASGLAFGRPLLAGIRLPSRPIPHDGQPRAPPQQS